MQVSINTLKLLSDQGDEDANFAMISYTFHTSNHRAVEAYYTDGMFVIHTPKMPGDIIPRRAYTLTGMPAATPSGIIIQDNDGDIVDDE